MWNLKKLIKVLSSPNHSNKSWVTNQYDQMVMGDTVQRSGSDAAIIRIHNWQSHVCYGGFC